MLIKIRLQETNIDGEDGTRDIKRPSPPEDKGTQDLKKPSDPEEKGTGDFRKPSGDSYSGYNPEFEVPVSRQKFFDAGNLQNIPLIKNNDGVFAISPDQADQYKNTDGYFVGKLLPSSMFQRDMGGFLRQVLEDSNWTMMSDFYNYSGFETKQEYRDTDRGSEPPPPTSGPNGQESVSIVREAIQLSQVNKALLQRHPIDPRDTSRPQNQQATPIFLPFKIEGFPVVVASDTEASDAAIIRKFVLELAKAINVSVPKQEYGRIMGLYKEYSELKKYRKQGEAKEKTDRIEPQVKDLSDQVKNIIQKLSNQPDTFPLIVNVEDEDGNVTVKPYDQNNPPNVKANERVAINRKIAPDAMETWNTAAKLFETGIAGLFVPQETAKGKPIITAKLGANGAYDYIVDDEVLTKVVGKKVRKAHSEDALMEIPKNLDEPEGEKITVSLADLFEAEERKKSEIEKVTAKYDDERKQFVSKLIDGIQIIKPAK